MEGDDRNVYVVRKQWHHVYVILFYHLTDGIESQVAEQQNVSNQINILLVQP